MRLRSCRVLMLIWILILITLPIQNALSQDTNGVTSLFDTYVTTKTKYNYLNLTNVEIIHPVNGSLVCEGQKLKLIVTPFDADTLGYSVDIYQSGVNIYSCGEETMYELGIYCDNPIDSVITLTFKINNEVILKLEYLALLDAPSLDRDYTEEWLKYQEEKEETGKDIVNMKKELTKQIQLVAITGLVCIGLSLTAGVIVVVFKQLNMFNLFTGIVTLFSSAVWLDNLQKLDAWMAGLMAPTSTQIFTYWSRFFIYTLIFIFSLLAYMTGYKLTKTRLKQKKYWGFDINGREVTEYHAVIHRHRGQVEWILQNSWDALRRLIKKVRYMEDLEGDSTDTWTLTEAKLTTENIGTRKHKRAIDSLLVDMSKRIEAESKDKELEPESDDKIQRKYNFDIWKYNEDNHPLRPDIPLVILKGNPEFVEVYKEEDYRTLKEQMQDRQRDISKIDDSTTAQEIKKIQNRFKWFKKGPKPIGYKVKGIVGNKMNYDMLHYQEEADYLNTQSKMITEQDREIHKLNIEKEVAVIKKAREKFEMRDKSLKDLKGRKALQDGGEVNESQ